ncbi:MAG: ATP-binding protein [Endomicrobiales bacterium]
MQTTKDKNNGLSIFHRLLLTILAVVVVISGILTGSFYFFSVRSVEKQANEDILQQAINIRHDFENGTAKSLTKDLRQLSSSPSLEKFMMSLGPEKGINAHEVEALFLQAVQHEQGYRSISFVDFSGKEQVRVNRSGRVRNYRDQGRAPLFHKIENRPAGDIGFEGPSLDRNGRPFFSAGIHIMDRDTGRFGGAIIIEYGLDHFFSFLDGLKIKGEKPLWVFAPDGRVLKQPLDPRKTFDPRPSFSKEPQTVPASTLSDEGFLVYQDLFLLPGAPLLRLALSVPASLLFQDVRSVLAFFSVVFSLSLVIVALIVFYVSKYLSRPIVELAGAAARLDKGDLSAQVEVKTTGEVRTLVESFNQMARTLQKTTVSKAYVDNILQSISDCLLVINPDLTIRTVNRTTLELSGYREEELAGKRVTDYFAEGDAFDAAEWHDFFKRGIVKNYELTFLPRTGERLPVNLSASEFKDTAGAAAGFVLIVHDVRPLKQLQMQLMQSEKMASLGLLAGGIAHEINNPMGVILGFAQSVARKIKEDHPLHLPLTSIEREAIRCKKLVADLLTFSRRSAPEMEKADLNAVIDTAVSLVATDTKIKNIEIVKEYGPGLPPANLNRNQIQQVIVNLCNNAVDAMPSGGRLTVKTELFAEKKAFMVRISDTGTGIPRDVQKRIFDPFFTTKDVGRGTGLGLSICYEIIQKHRGTVEVDSAPGQGTTFTFFLPLNG